MNLKYTLGIACSLFVLSSFSQIDPLLEYVLDYSYHEQKNIPLYFSQDDTCSPRISTDSTCNNVLGRLYEYNDSISLVILSNQFFASQILAFYSQSDDANLFKEYIYVSSPEWSSHAILSKRNKQMILFAYSNRVCAECLSNQKSFKCVAYRENGLIEKYKVESIVLAIGFIESNM